MKREELTKTFMLISNWKRPLVSMVYTKAVSALRVKRSPVANIYPIFTNFIFEQL